jgi:hypothetical protein
MSVKRRGHRVIDERKTLIFIIFGEGALENGNPTEKHYADTSNQASEEHDLQDVLAPKH